MTTWAGRRICSIGYSNVTRATDTTPLTHTCPRIVHILHVPVMVPLRIKSAWFGL